MQTAGGGRVQVGRACHAELSTKALVLFEFDQTN